MTTTLTDAQVEAAATFLEDARAQGGPLPQIPDEFRPASIQDGTRIAERLSGVADRRPEGWKAGASSAAQLRDLGTKIPPTAPLFEGVIRESPAQLDAAAFHRCVMEAEVAFRMRADLPARDRAYSLDEVRDAVASAHLAIEAANAPFADGLGVGLPSLIAAGFAVGHLILGPEITDWRQYDLQALDVELLLDGDVAARGLEGEARCDPLAVLEAMANDFSARGFGLETGQVVTTGAAAVAPAKPGQTVVARFAGLGDVVATLA